MSTSGCPLTETVALLISREVAMIFLTRVTVLVESVVVTGSGILKPLRKSVQSGVGLAFGSPLGGVSSRRGEGTGPLAATPLPKKTGRWGSLWPRRAEGGPTRGG